MGIENEQELIDRITEAVTQNVLQSKQEKENNDVETTKAEHEKAKEVVKNIFSKSV